MQGVMIAYLIPRYPLAKLVLILFVIKECYMTVAGWKVLMETKETIEAQWHGKLNTAVTYVVVLILLAGPRLPYSTSNVLIGACAVCMAMSLSMYAAQFRECWNTRMEDISGKCRAVSVVIKRKINLRKGFPQRGDHLPFLSDCPYNRINFLEKILPFFLKFQLFIETKIFFTAKMTNERYCILRYD